MKVSSEPSNVSAEVLMGHVAEEFLDRLNRGEQPEVESYVRRYPQLAGVLRQMLPALELMRTPGVNPVADGEPSAGPSLLAGCLGDYRILREVGRGGMGVVYEAEQLSLDRRVALKVLPFAAALDPKQLQRFKNEAQAAAHLHHTHIVPVFAVGCDRGVHYYAMQFIEGRTLAALITELRQLAGREPVPERATPAPMPGPAGQILSGNWAAPGGSADPERTGPYGPEAAATRAGDTTLDPAKPGSAEHSFQSPGFFRTVAQLGIQAGEALEHAHQLGVIHRDIKPGNLLVDIASPAPSGRGVEGLRLWVTDFGLALCKSQAGLSMAGDLVGTLRYMSPEQALAQRVPVDHRTDIYSLGATLYELLTLEPAFGGRDRQELLRQIAFEEPRPPRRLNKAMPPELATIVGKAMEKNPAERYATAQELADDLERYLKDEPIRARRPGLVQRARKWARRHRAAVRAGALSLLAMVLALAGSIGWVVRERAARREEGELRVRDAFREAGRRLEEEKWREGLSFVGQAEAVLRGSGGSEALLDQAARLRWDLEMAQRLEEARLEMTAGTNGPISSVQTGAAAYAEAFEKYGLDVDGLGLQEAVTRLRASPICRQLTAALDDWAYLLKTWKGKGWQRRLALARAADPDRWRNRLRDALERKDTQALEEVLQSASPANWPAATLVLLGRLAEGKAFAERTAGLLRRAQQQHPSDFWINTTLGWILAESQPPRLEEAIRYYGIAVALRPRSAGAHNNLGGALGRQGKLDEAIAALHKAIELGPKFARAHCNLGTALSAQGKLDEAIAEHRKAIDLDPLFAEAHCNLGNALREQGKLDEALAEHRKAIDLDPKLWQAHHNLGVTLARKGRVNEAIGAYQKASACNPKSAETLCSLGIFLGRHGKVDEASAALHKAIELSPQQALAHNGLGILLARQGKLDEAIAEFQEAVAIDPKLADVHSNLRIALVERGKLHEAIPFYTREINRLPGSAALRRRRGDRYLELGDRAKALADYSKVVELEPEDAAGWSRVALFLATCPDVKLRDPGRAYEMARKAVALAPRDGNCWQTLGWTAYYTGNWKAALEAAEKALPLRNGGDCTDWFSLAMVHWQLGHKEKARQWYDRANQWMMTHHHAAWPRFRAEAAAVLGIPMGPAAQHKEEPRSKP